MATKAFVYLSELDDLFQDATIGTTAGSSTGFPFANSQTSDIAELWISAPVTGGSGTTVIHNIDLGSSLPWSEVAILNHTYPQTATITVKSGPTAGVGANSDTMTWRQFNMYFLAATPRTHRYLQITVNDTANPYTLSHGRILVGPATYPPMPPRFGDDIGWTQELVTKSNDLRSNLNAKNIDTLCQYARLTFTFGAMTNAHGEAFYNFLATLKGNRYWFFLIPITSEYHGYVVRLMSVPLRVRNFHNSFPVIELEEESRGVQVLT